MLFAFVMVVVMFVAVAPPASAAVSGHLLIRGPGSAYTAQGGSAWVIPPGKSKYFHLKIVNDGGDSAVFDVALTNTSQLVTQLYRGSAQVAGSFTSPSIRAGKTYSFKVKVSVPAGTTQQDIYPDPGPKVRLRDPDTQDQVDAAGLQVGVPALVVGANPVGNTSTDLYLGGSYGQKYVGGPVTGQQFYPGSVRVRGSVRFTIRLVNHGTEPSSIPVSSTTLIPCPEMSLKVKQGSTDVTSAISAGTYSTALLDPGKRRDLKATVTLNSPVTSPSCGFLGLFMYFSSSSVNVFLSVHPAV